MTVFDFISNNSNVPSIDCLKERRTSVTLRAETTNKSIQSLQKEQ